MENEWDKIFENVSDNLYRLPSGNYVSFEEYLKENYYPPNKKLDDVEIKYNQCKKEYNSTSWWKFNKKRKLRRKLMFLQISRVIEEDNKLNFGDYSGKVD